MAAAEEDTELRDLLVQTLESSGVLNKIKVRGGGHGADGSRGGNRAWPSGTGAAQPGPATARSAQGAAGAPVLAQPERRLVGAGWEGSR